jgi:polysaccharide pyruvyl transferase WcaK-like protein
MIAIDTQEKLDWIMNALEDQEIILDNRKRSKEDDEEVCKAIAEHKAELQKKQAEEPVPA